MWWLWNNHYKRSLAIGDQTKMERLRTNQTIRRNWNAIARLHPERHAQFKRLLCDAIDRASVSQTDSNTAVAAAQASIGNDQATRRQRTDAYERALRASIQYLREITFLVNTETLIGAPAHAIRVFDSARVAPARAQLNGAAIRVAEQRRDELRPLDIWSRRRELNAHREVSARAAVNQVPRSTFVPMFGGNNDTNLCLWIQGDVNGNIVERSVIKDVCFDYDPVQWDNAVNWQNAGDPLNKVLTEAHVMKRVGETGSENVVMLRCCQLRVSELMFRVSLKLQWALLELSLITI